jgi:hypothetical protein
MAVAKGGEARRCPVVESDASLTVFSDWSRLMTSESATSPRSSSSSAARARFSLRANLPVASLGVAVGLDLPAEVLRKRRQRMRGEKHVRRGLVRTGYGYLSPGLLHASGLLVLAHAKIDGPS